MNHEGNASDRLVCCFCFAGIARLVSALLATNHQAVNARLVECRTLDALLDLFFKYSLNNFLHSTVEGCLAQVSAMFPISWILNLNLTSL